MKLLKQLIVGGDLGEETPYEFVLNVCICICGNEVLGGIEPLKFKPEEELSLSPWCLVLFVLVDGCGTGVVERIVITPFAPPNLPLVLHYLLESRSRSQGQG